MRRIPGGCAKVGGVRLPLHLRRERFGIESESSERTARRSFTCAYRGMLPRRYRSTGCSLAKRKGQQQHERRRVDSSWIEDLLVMEHVVEAMMHSVYRICRGRQPRFVQWAGGTIAAGSLIG